MRRRLQTGLFKMGFRVTRLIVSAIGVLLCAFVALFSYRYLLGNVEMPRVIANNLFKHPWLLIHAAGAATALLIGPVQFSGAIRARLRRLHRWLGRVYVISCLIGAVSGFVLALGASTGWISTTGFASLAILWTITISLAWRRATQRQFVEHRAWMIRSFALTFAAVTLRLYLPALSLFGVGFANGYRAISFLSWVPNLLVAELYLRATKPQTRTAPAVQIQEPISFPQQSIESRRAARPDLYARS